MSDKFSLYDTLFQPGTAPIVGAVITAIVSINSFFLKWLMTSFNSLRADIKGQAEIFEKQIDKHEFKDQERHEENLYRFEKISVALGCATRPNPYKNKET